MTMHAVPNCSASGWPSVELSDVTDLLTDGTHYTPPNISEGIPFLTVKDVSEEGLDFSNCSKISPEEYEAAARQNSAPKWGDVLFSKDGTVGKVHLVREKQPFAVLSSLAILRPAKHIDGAYLAHFLRTSSTIDAASNKKTGSAIRRIILRDLATLKIPVPPLDEQRRIAAILDKADALRRKRKRALDLLNGLTKSIVAEVSRYKSPNRVRIGDFASVKGGKRLPKGHDYSHKKTQYKYLRVTDIQKEKINRAELKDLGMETYHQIKKYTVAANDVAISIAGTIGLTLHIDEELAGVNLTENAAKISIFDHNRVDPVFVSHVLQTEDLQSQIRASTGQVTIGKLALFRIEELEVPMPSIALQRQVRTSLAVVKKQKKSFRYAYAMSEVLFSSLQHRAFTGQL